MKTVMNICIVEDSPLILERLKRMIVQIPEIRVAAVAADLKTAGQVLLQIVAEKNDRIDVVILDTQLPDGNSLEMLATVKQLHPDIKVVVFSNHASEQDRFLAQRAGADRFLDKSSDSELLVPLLKLWH